MAYERYIIRNDLWMNLLAQWRREFRVLAPQREKRGLYLHPVTPENSESIVYNEVRAAQPLKSFLLPPLEEITDPPQPTAEPFLFLGAKACDLSALSILDSAFGGDFSDPPYRNRRNGSLFISSDCTDPLETCFCTLVGGKPYPTRDFDLNLTPLEGGFLVTIGTDRGKALLKEIEASPVKPDKSSEQAAARLHEKTEKNVNRLNKEWTLSGSLKARVSGKWESEAWGRHTEPCVECGVCNHACPTCHCYFLDDVARRQLTKLRGWDACLYSGYAVTAGGGTPRPRLYQRFRNRYFCKFKYLDDNYGQCGCTGCGRCIEGCQGKIDMRATLQDLKP
jgi:sulfhydrogenase subunit beta (sulfur reductase)